MMMMMAVWGDCGNKYWEMSRPGPGLRVWPGTRGQALNRGEYSEIIGKLLKAKPQKMVRFKIQEVKTSLHPSEPNLLVLKS